MSALVQPILAVLRSAIRDLVGSNDDIEGYLIVTSGTKDAFGDYQCNSAMPLAKQLNKSPREVAAILQAALVSAELPLEKVEIAGPGFINMHLNESYLVDYCEKIFDSDDLLLVSGAPEQRVVIDYSSPNVAKAMHVGHLRSTVIGDCLARVFKHLKYDVMALNHIGDWGTAFGMLIAYLEDEAPEALAGNEEPDVNLLVGWYKAAKARFDADPAFKAQSQLAVVALQRGDATKREAWARICEISRQSYQRIYDLLGVQLLERGESFYQPYLAGVIDDLKAKSLLTTHDGASCVFLPQFKNRAGEALPLIVQKSDGGYNYATTDLAAVKHRLREEHADRVVYVVDAGQGLHFDMVFATARAVGYADDRVALVHVPFGLVLGEDGKKFKTRSGETVKLMDLLEEAIARAKALLLEREVDWPAPEIEATACSMGLGAVKYADLSVNRASDYQFAFDKMLSFDGNTAIFVMYACVRLGSIMRAAGEGEAAVGRAALRITHPSERALALHLARFEDCLRQVIADYKPNRLTDYCFKLAELCHAFHRDCRVVGSDMQASRLKWCALSRRVLCVSLGLLGISVPTRM